MENTTINSINPEIQPYQTEITVIGSSHNKIEKNPDFVGTTYPDTTIEYVANIIQGNDISLLGVDGLGITMQFLNQRTLGIANRLGIDGLKLLLADPSASNNAKDITRASLADIAIKSLPIGVLATVDIALLISLAKSEKEKLSRRTFLKRGIVASTAISSLWSGSNLLHFAAGEAMSRDRNPDRRKMIQALYKKTATNQPFPDWWIEGRTAVMIQKAIESNHKKAAYLFGSRHLLHTDEIISNEARRTQYIYDFLYQTFQSASEIKNLIGQTNPVTLEEVRSKLLQQTATALILIYGKSNHNFNNVEGEWKSPLIMQIGEQIIQEMADQNI